jgi:pectin methylesterase-like acyl-CoA thioesterase
MTHKRFRYDYVIVLLCLICYTMLLPLNAVILPVAMDGSQQYTSIQSAVQSSAHGDTVLVYPGTYMENVNYSGKNITIASLELTTGDPSYRQTTIIDGNHNGCNGS